MGETGLYDSLQIAYEFIEQANRLSERNEYEPAYTALQKAKSYAFNNTTLLEDIQRRGEELQAERRQYIKDLETEAIQLFNQERFDGYRARQVLQDLLHQDDHNDLARRLWEELPTKEAVERERRLVEDTQHDMAQIWQRAREFEEIGAGSRAVAEYERALTEISIKAGDAPALIPLQRLKLEAAEKRDQAKDRWVGTPTLILARKGQELVDRYETWQRRGEIEAEFFDENGEFLGRLPIEECVDRAKKLASRFAEQKAQDYLGQARELLAESPGAAYDKIQDALAIAYPSDFARSILEKELKEKIEPAMQRREQAINQVKAALSKENPVEAWQTLNEVEQIDRFTPELEDARQRLLPLLKQEFTRLIEAGQRLQELEEFDLAHARFETASDIGRMTFSGGETFQGLYTAAQEALEAGLQAETAARQFDQRLEEMAHLSQTDPEQAKAQLNALLTPELSRPAAAKVERLRLQIDFKLGLDQLLQNLTEKMLATSEAVELIPLEEAARQATLNYAGEERLARLVERLTARRLFLEAARLRQNPEEYLAVRDRLQQVIDYRGDDAPAAQAILNEITIDERQETDIAAALQEASAALNNDDARGAFLLLEPYRHAISRQTGQLRDVYSKAAARWRSDLDTRLEHLTAAGEFILPRIELLLQELERCQSPRLDEWRARALAPAYANTANDLQELNRWEQAGELWNAAFQLAPNDPRILEGRRNSQKHRDLIRAEMTFNPAEKEQLLNDLNRVYGDDALIKRYLAEFYYAQERHVEARMALSQIKFLAEHSAIPVANTEMVAVERLETLIQQAERTEKRKFAIRSQVTGKTTISELIMARQAQTELLKSAPPDQTEKLQEWWLTLVKEVTDQMKTEVSKLTDSGGAILARTELLCKILALQADPDIQEQAERMLRLTYHRLPLDVQDVVDNPEGIGYGPAAQALSNHIARAKELHKRLVNLGQVERYAAQLSLSLGERSLDLNDTLYQLELSLEKLYAARDIQLEIKNLVVVAMMTGNWESVEDSLQELDRRGLSQHRGLRELPAEIEAARRKRADLEAAVVQIKEAMNQESFKVIQDRLTYMSLQDPADETQLQAGLEVIDPHTGLTLRGRQELETAIAEKLEVMEKLRKWQAACHPPVDWSAARAKIMDGANSGDFASALALGRAVMSSDDQHQAILQDDTWSLGHLRQYLESPPVSQEQLNTSRAETIFSQVRQKADILNRQYNECGVLLQELRQKEKEFTQIVDNLKPLLNRLNEGKDFLGSLLSPSAENQEVKTRITGLVRRGRQLCPRYPAFVNFDEKNLVRR